MKKTIRLQANSVLLTNKYLSELINKSAAVSRQFLKINSENKIMSGELEDPLLEEENRIMPGLVKKYENRVLVELTLRCAAHCQFCTRKRKISNPDLELSFKDLEKNSGIYQS